MALIGLPGVGKSSILSHFPNVKFICDKRDQGILDLIDYSSTTGVKLSPEDVVIVNSYNLLLGELQAAQHDTEHTTFVIESFVGIQSLCNDHTMVTDYDFPTNPRAANLFVNYRNGHDISANVHFQRLVDIMISLQNSGRNVWCTGHSKVGMEKNITGDDWVSQVLDLSPEMARRVKASFANILHIGQSVSTAKAGSKNRAMGEYTSCIYTDINPLFPAKNRMGLHDAINYEYGADNAYLGLCKALKLNPKTGLRL